MRERAAVVLWCQEERKVLLMHRWKNGDEYWIIPGGGVEEGETFPQAAVRETLEEVGVRILEEDLHPLCYHEDENTREWNYFAIRPSLDETRVGGPEALRASETNRYEPTWVPIEKVRDLEIWPQYMGLEISKRCDLKKDRSERVELTTMCLVVDGDKVLLQNRHKDSWSGYAMPGGHVEKGESFVEAVKREVREETGLLIEDPVLVGVKQFPIDNGRYIVFLFKATKFSGELTSSDEGHMEWFRREDLPNIKTVGDFDPLLEVFDRADLSEFRYTIDPDGEWILHLY
ncbi:MAG: NUDIX domain-containing protein [Firmicutes bacterium]|nr:NUDIX domain-containing protein [Bacillota bacterium]